jgi:hypothetical protein
MGQEHPAPVAPNQLAGMDTPRIYEIRVEGHLADRWSDWFEGLTIRNDPNGETILSGPITDQAALFGVLAKIHNLNLILNSVLGDPVTKE